MENLITERALAKKLLDELDLLADYWVNFFKNGGGLYRTSLHSFDGGGTFTYVGTESIKVAVEIFYLLLENQQNNALAEKTTYVDKEFDKLFEDIFGEYFDFSPDEVNAIAYLVYNCYKNRDLLFIDLNREALSLRLNRIPKIKIDLTEMEVGKAKE